MSTPLKRIRPATYAPKEYNDRLKDIDHNFQTLGDVLSGGVAGSIDFVLVVCNEDTTMTESAAAGMQNTVPLNEIVAYAGDAISFDTTAYEVTLLDSSKEYVLLGGVGSCITYTQEWRWGWVDSTATSTFVGTPQAQGYILGGSKHWAGPATWVDSGGSVPVSYIMRGHRTGAITVPDPYNAQWNAYGAWALIYTLD